MAVLKADIKKGPAASSKPAEYSGLQVLPEGLITTLTERFHVTKICTVYDLLRKIVEHENFSPEVAAFVDLLTEKTKDSGDCKTSGPDEMSGIQSFLALCITVGLLDDKGYKKEWLNEKLAQHIANSIIGMLGETKTELEEGQARTLSMALLSEVRTQAIKLEGT